ncbi:MAG: lamin tail domain-containing protein [Polyangiaceae bacterium]
MPASPLPFVRRLWPALALGALFAACSFPEHDFIPKDDFDKLKNGNSGGIGFGGFDAGGGTGLTGATGGSGGASGGASGTGGASGGSGGVDAGSGGAGGTGGTVPSCAGRCGQAGPVPGSIPSCYCESSCTGFANCCSDYDTVCGTGGTGGATGGTGGATGGTGGATGGTGGTGGATGGTGGGGCTTVLVNEVASTGPNGGFDEFVELFNYGTCTASLNGWSVKYSSSSGAAQDVKWTGGAAVSLAGGAYYVIAGPNFSGTPNATLSGSGLGDNGGIALFDAGDNRVDSVAYGSVSPTHPYIEGTAFADTPTSTKSASRTPNAKDTNDNSQDFTRLNRSPGALNL